MFFPERQHSAVPDTKNTSLFNQKVRTNTLKLGHELWATCDSYLVREYVIPKGAHIKIPNAGEPLSD